MAAAAAVGGGRKKEKAKNDFEEQGTIIYENRKHDPQSNKEICINFSIIIIFSYDIYKSPPLKTKHVSLQIDSRVYKFIFLSFSCSFPL